MNKNKRILTLSVTGLWLLLAVFTLLRDREANIPVWSQYTGEEAETRLNIEQGLASVVYGPLASGDTQVVLHHPKGDVEAVLPPSVSTQSASVFPAGDKRLGVLFREMGKLDTVVLFTENRASVFENVLALDTENDRIAYLQADAQSKLDLVISTLDRIDLQRRELEAHTAEFLDHPEIERAGFEMRVFWLRTPFGLIKTEVPELI